ncbi:MAG: dihydropteroate synthase [Rhodobacter sp.]|nr:dihydropteroate synthase [Rhodobacter sp.]
MIRRCHPVPRTGRDARFGVMRDTALPLAGSDHVWFDSANVWTRSEGWRFMSAGELHAGDRSRLSVGRAAICGVSLKRPAIMGIVNVTPDSFSDGGDRMAPEDALAAIRSMRDADIIDVGGESTRPGAETVPVSVEIARVVPVIKAARGEGIAVPISIDTRKAAVAEAALDAGANLVNDVSALTFDPAMAGLVAEREVHVCLMHAQGEPPRMQDAPNYEDALLDIFGYLETRIRIAEAAGVARERIIIDPGIGFGKTLQHNLTLLRALSLYHDLGVPLLLGASRKSVIGTIGGAPGVRDRLPGSLAAALYGYAQGAHILRVHDVSETRQALDTRIAMDRGEWNGG